MQIYLLSLSSIRSAMRTLPEKNSAWTRIHIYIPADKGRCIEFELWDWSWPVLIFPLTTSSMRRGKMSVWTKWSPRAWHLTEDDNISEKCQIESVNTHSDKRYRVLSVLLLASNVWHWKCCFFCCCFFFPRFTNVQVCWGVLKKKKPPFMTVILSLLLDPITSL